MKENVCRIVKIEKDALFEFIYENFIAQQGEILDVSAEGCMNNFAIDWNNGAFIFTAHKGENADGNIIPFPNDIDINKALAMLPATTDSILSAGKKYKDYSFDELRKITNEDN